ncbi:PAS domain-containing protein [Rhodovastum atsumiense]|uniref:histidine kinase n=1 Tax=Rhodovastum atsumiense TaxID=504468 RepID=A0A5M6IRD3_9PROT|nr:PAS domain-containing protein [Rhodovastum atsumiense]KAA5610852.1 PAS domain-containing protein [Rhodovastum atsumiense]
MLPGAAALLLGLGTLLALRLQLHAGSEALATIGEAGDPALAQVLRDATRAHGQATQLAGLAGLGSLGLMLLALLATDRSARAHRRAMAALAGNESRLRLATEAAELGTWELDLIAGHGTRSPASVALLGGAPARFTAAGWAEAIDPRDRPDAAATWARALADGLPFEMTFRPAAHAAGTEERWLVARGRIVQDAAGQPVRAAGILLDATARGRAEAALRDSEATLTAVLESLPIGVNIADARGRIIRNNAAERELWGSPPETPGWEHYAEWVGFWPETGARIQAHEWAMARALLHGEVVRGELVECRRFGTGEPRIFLNNAAPIRDAAGAIVGAVTAEFDITDRRRAAAALAASEAQLRTIVETVPVGLVMAEFPSGRIVGGNAYVETLLRHPVRRSPDIDGYDEWVAFHADGSRVDGHEYPLARMALHGEENPSIEVQYQRGDGTRAWTRIMGRPVRDETGRITGGVVALVDVDGERRAREALTESEAQLRLALEAGRMGLWTWDLAEDRLQWDARQFELFGIDPKDGEPTGTAALARVHPEDRPGLRAAIEATLAPGATVSNHEFRIVLPGGGVRWLASHWHVTAAPDGRGVRLVGLNFDVTERREAAEVLAREAAQLEQLAEQRAQALAESELRLAEAARMEALGRLAGGIAHDFNNVLQAVQGRLLLAERRLGRDIDAVRQHLDRAVEATARGTAVTGRLLAFARRDVLRAEAIAPAPLLEGLAEMLRPTLGADITLRVEAEPALPTLLADRGQLEAVLVNLANNARDAMANGGTLVLRAEALPAPGPDAPPELAPEAYLRLAVADDGEGMPPDVLARVAEPFFTTKPKGKGTGLGLAMARGFAGQSGGALVIASAPGVGTTVSLWLPQFAVAGMAVPPTSAPAEAGGATAETQATVLVVEDNADIREILMAELTERGFVVTETEHAAAALALLDGGLRPDAVVTDLTMPGELDGLGLVEEARSRLPRLPAVLVTGHAGSAASQRLAAAERGGPFAMVRKPASPTVLAERLDRVLGQGRRGLVAS